MSGEGSLLAMARLKAVIPRPRHPWRVYILVPAAIPSTLDPRPPIQRRNSLAVRRLEPATLPALELVGRRPDDPDEPQILLPLHPFPHILLNAPPERPPPRLFRCWIETNVFVAGGAVIRAAVWRSGGGFGTSGPASFCLSCRGHSGNLKI